MSDDVDLAVVREHALAEKICEALSGAGIRFDFWPEDILSDSIGLIGRGPFEPVFRTRGREPRGPFHIRVAAEDLHDAQFVLLNSGLKGV
jgi:hypothetical protein